LFDQRSSLRQLESEAFSSFDHLSAITIPSSVQQIRHHALRG
jgi:hypothetical protein